MLKAKTASGKFGLKNGDQVQVMVGKDKGKLGKVVRVDRVLGRIVVEKVNLVKRHMKPTQKNPQGGISEKESPIHYSNALLFCSKCNRGVRYGIKSSEGKKGIQKTRYCKKCETPLDEK